MITQENIDRLIRMVGLATEELTVMQGILIEVSRILIQDKGAQEKQHLTYMGEDLRARGIPEEGGD